MRLLWLSALATYAATAYALPVADKAAVGSIAVSDKPVNPPVSGKITVYGEGLPPKSEKLTQKCEACMGVCLRVCCRSRQIMWLVPGFRI